MTTAVVRQVLTLSQHMEELAPVGLLFVVDKLATSQFLDRVVGMA